MSMQLHALLCVGLKALLAVHALPKPAPNSDITPVQKGGGWQSSYGKLASQQGMLMDHVRMAVYQNATRMHTERLNEATVMDVGTGSGVLAHFLAQAGARKIYAVEASNMSLVASRLLKASGHGDKVEVLHSALEDVEIPELVDALVSEPIGIILLHERMLETFVTARDRFLKPGGLLLPNGADLVITPLTNPTLRSQQLASAAFWNNSDYYGYNLTEAYEQAVTEAYQRIFIGQIPPDSLLSSDFLEIGFDFHTVTVEELREIDIPLNYTISHTGQMDGFVLWFNAYFEETAVLKTSPNDTLTHWWHVQMLFRDPLEVEKDQNITGVMRFRGTADMGINVTFEVQSTAGHSASGSVDTSVSTQLPYINVHEFEGWRRHWSAEHHNFYYYSEERNVSTWDPSTEKAVKAHAERENSEL